MFCFAFCISLYSETRELKKGDNGKTWYLVSNNSLYGAEDISGNLIIPIKYSSVHYVSNLGYRDYFIVDDAELEGEVTGYGYKSAFKGVYAYNGDLIIPTNRGYSGIWGFKSNDSDQLFYIFEIKFNGVHIEGICDVHGKELWSRDFQDDHDDDISYAKYDGFYYISNKTGKEIKLDIRISKSDNSFNTYSSNTSTPSFSERIGTAKQEYETYLSSEIIRKKHFESNSFQWYECRDAQGNNWAENVNGVTIVPPRKFCVIVFHCSNYTSGFFERRILDDGNYRIEAYTKEGNILIPDTRNYLRISYPDPTEKYIVIGNKNGIGIADLNGNEVVEPNYERFEYDGYDFVGYKESGVVVKKNIHRRPTRVQKEKISSWGGYYSNMPWLMMPGPTYTPCIDINTPISDWNSIPIFGGVGDFVPSYSSDPCVNAAIGVANSSNRLMQQGVNVANTPSNQTASRKCPYCNGTGKKVYETYSVSTFGLSDPNEHCNECGGDFPKSRAHSHITCGQCGGSGIAR